MTKTYFKIFITICGVCVCFSGCGRKQKSVFSFPDKPEVKINKLQFGSVRGIQIVKSALGNRITWLPAKDAVGYNVYRLARRLIVAKKPANKELIQTTSFIDVPNYNACGYFVRPVFMLSEKKIEGPASQIIYLD